MKWRPGGNWGSKLICLFVAFLLWVFIMNDQNPLVEGSYDLPVEVHNLDSSLVVMDAPRSVHVKLRMQRNTMLGLRPTDMKAILDLAEIEPGRHENMSVRLVLPRSAEVLSQSPQQFPLRVENVTSKVLQVTPRINVTEKDQYSGTIDRVSPDVVTITGPESLVTSVAQAGVDIALNGRKENFEIITPVTLHDAAGDEVTGLTVAPADVTVQVAVTPLMAEKELPLIANISGSPQTGYRIGQVEIEPEKVALTGPKVILDSLTGWHLPPVSVDGAEHDVVTQVMIARPQGGTAEPETAEVHVRIVPDLR